MQLGLEAVPEGSELTRVFAASNCLVSMVAFPSSCPGTAAGEPGAGPGFNTSEGTSRQITVLL